MTLTTTTATTAATAAAAANCVVVAVDASKAGEGQLEISINDGDVPNAVQVTLCDKIFLNKTKIFFGQVCNNVLYTIQVLGGGKCLVTFTPEQAITHEIEVTFNNDQVSRDQEGKYDTVRMEISEGAWLSVPLPRAGRRLRQRGRG